VIILFFPGGHAFGGVAGPHCKVRLHKVTWLQYAQDPTSVKKDDDMDENVDQALNRMRRMLPVGHHLIMDRSVNALRDESLTMGQRIAGGVLRNMGSWRFIIIQSSIL
jgi:hypothetical protein